jgi:hypothetical protein
MGSLEPPDLLENTLRTQQLRFQLNTQREIHLEIQLKVSFEAQFPRNVSDGK